jgi:hypothetical protein
MTDLTIAAVRSQIITLPNRPPFMLGASLAEFYETRTDRITEAVKRNPDRFPEDFAFRLTRGEAEVLKTQNALSKDTNHLPLVFTRAGAHALSGVLKTKVAAERSVTIYRAFAAMEETAQIQRPEPDLMEITKDEYIDLLQNKLALVAPKPAKRRPVRGLTPEDVAQIIRLRDAGYSQSAIAKAVGRSTATVSFTVRMAGGPLNLQNGSDLDHA